MAIIAKNKEGLFSYEIQETFQAGIALTGAETKAVKAGQISLKGSYVTIDQKSEVWLVNCHISAYKPAQGQQRQYDPERPKKLLLHQREIKSLLGKSRQKGLTIIPISIYTVKRLIKADIALARGKSKIDKRDSIKKREINREINRVIKGR